MTNSRQTRRILCACNYLAYFFARQVQDAQRTFYLSDGLDSPVSFRVRLCVQSQTL